MKCEACGREFNYEKTDTYDQTVCSKWCAKEKAEKEEWNDKHKEDK